MKRILVLYYSQSGDVARAAKTLTAPLERRGAEVVWRRIEPYTPYPYPWRKIDRFFDVFPESVVGDAPAIQPLNLPADPPFDLVVLAYQVWFLSPSLPVQGFLKSPDAKMLESSPVVTLSVSRNMRMLAGRRMKRILQGLNAIHVGEAAVTHQGSPLATFFTTPRALLTGRRNRLWGVLPAAGVGPDGLTRLERLGENLAAWLDELQPVDTRNWKGDNRGYVPIRDDPPQSNERASPWDDYEAAPVNWRYLFSELAAWPSFFVWARIVRWLGRHGTRWRRLGVYLFVGWLLPCIAVFVPLGLALSPVIFLAAKLATGKPRRPDWDGRAQAFSPFAGCAEASAQAREANA